jgi:hypothetical protein
MTDKNYLVTKITDEGVSPFGPFRTWEDAVQYATEANYLDEVYGVAFCAPLHADSGYRV